MGRPARLEGCPGLTEAPAEPPGGGAAAGKRVPPDGAGAIDRTMPAVPRITRPLATRQDPLRRGRDGGGFMEKTSGTLFFAL
jgi:hypothetical protein